MLRSAHEWGTVYVIQCAVLYKIGFTAGSVQQRMRTLQAGSFQKFTLVCEIPSRNPAALEKEIHMRLTSKHVRGEWYRLTRRDLHDLKVMEAEERRKMIGEQMRRAQEQADWI